MKKILLAFSLFFLALMSHAQCCDYYLNMTDSYGDGWNGGSVELFIDGISQGSFSAMGYGSYETFEVCQGQNIELIYTAADWENENAYQWINPVGQVQFSDGTYPNEGSVYTGEIDCSTTVILGEVPCSALYLDTTNCIIADNTGLVASGFEPSCANYQGEDIWFEIEVPSSGNVIINTEGTGGMSDTGLAIWESSFCAGINQIACDDDSGNGYYSYISLNNLEPGSILYAQVWSYGGGTGEFQICLSDPGTVILESSELPIVDINTYGQEIPNEPKIDAFMRLIYNGPGTQTAVSDSANIYYGHIGIEIRGASSAGYPQKPYGFETRDSLGENNNVPLLGMPAENDWVFLSNYNDKSFVRNMLSQHLFREMGHYAPRMTLCEMQIDSVYKGIYLIGEKIKRDIGRVDIATLNPWENTGDDVTGGYIFKSDLGNSSNSWFSNYSPIDHPGLDIRFVYHYPKAEDITELQKDYLAAFVDSMETSLYASEFTDPALGYRSMMDVNSFIDYFIISELSRNNDGFKKSRYYHKDKNSNGGKLHAGPTWDFDWAWKNINECDIFAQTDGSGWGHHVNDCNPDNDSPGWYLRMLQDSTFANELNCRYNYLRTTILDTTYLYNYIDSVADLVGNAQARHYQKWPTLGINVGTPEIGPIPETFQGEVDFLKDWIGLRVAWLDDNMPGQCISSGIEEEGRSTFHLFPNPSERELTVRGVQQGDEIHLYDNQGRLLETHLVGQQFMDLTISIDQAGMYFCRVFRGGKDIGYERIVIK